MRHEGKRVPAVHRLSLYLSNTNREHCVAYKRLLEELYPLQTNVHMYSRVLHDDTIGHV